MISGDFFVSYTYQRSFDNDRLAQCLFGSSTLHFQGSTATNRLDTSLLSQVGLPRNFDGYITFRPQLQTQTIDLNLELRSGRFDGWYMQLLAPIQHVNWNLNACETDLVPVDDLEMDYPAGYFGEEAVTVPNTTIKQALAGTATFGDMNQPWKYGKFCFDSRTETGLANLEARLGWDFYRCDNYHIGAYALVQGPTGTSVHADYFFSPIVGEGKHWKLGGGVTAHYEFWACEDKSLLGYFEGNAGHMFKKTQKRSFEFANHGCCMSRYVLLKEFDVDNNFTGNEINAINFATRNAQVTIGAEGEFKAELLYRQGCWKAGLGYNFYGRSHEEVCINPSPLTSIDSTKRYGFKGCSGDYYYEYATQLADDVEVTTDAAPTAQLLNATQSGSSMCMCGVSDDASPIHTAATADVEGSVGVSYRQENGAPNVTAGTAVSDLAIADASNPPFTFAADDTGVLNPNSGAMPALLSHTVYAHISYQPDICGWQPEFIFGGEGEFRQSDRCCSLSQWGVWVAGQLGF
jgi:hypothetical protein